MFGLLGGPTLSLLTGGLLGSEKFSFLAGSFLGRQTFSLLTGGLLGGKTFSFLGRTDTCRAAKHERTQQENGHKHANGG